MDSIFRFFSLLGLLWATFTVWSLHITTFCNFYRSTFLWNLRSPFPFPWIFRAIVFQDFLASGASGSVLMVFLSHSPSPRHFFPLHNFLEHPEALKSTIPKLWPESKKLKIHITLWTNFNGVRFAHTVCFNMICLSIMIFRHPAVWYVPMSVWHTCAGALAPASAPAAGFQFFSFYTFISRLKLLLFLSLLLLAKAFAAKNSALNVYSHVRVRQVVVPKKNGTKRNCNSWLHSLSQEREDLLLVAQIQCVLLFLLLFCLNVKIRPCTETKCKDMLEQNSFNVLAYV